MISKQSRQLLQLREREYEMSRESDFAGFFRFMVA